MRIREPVSISLTHTADHWKATVEYDGSPARLFEVLVYLTAREQLHHNEVLLLCPESLVPDRAALLEWRELSSGEG